MGEPIYKLWLFRPTDAFYQMSEEGQADHVAKINAALEKAGGKRLLACETRWCSEEWVGFGVEEFPDIEAVQKFTELLEEFGHYRFISGTSLLGTKWEV